MASSDRLTPLQRELLTHFFALASPAWFLTGGGALAGFWLGHRTTGHLDLFALEGELEEGVRLLAEVASHLGGTARVLIKSGDFARFLVTCGSDSVVVDLVRDRVPALFGKTLLQGVRLDSPREIAANKLTTLVTRAEPRDLVDLQALIATGISLDDILENAIRKDLSADPATVAWVLSTSVLPETGLPDGVDREAIVQFRDWLEAELRRRAAPAR